MPKCILCNKIPVNFIHKISNICNVYQCPNCSLVFVYPLDNILKSPSSGKFTIKTDEGYSQNLLNNSDKISKRYRMIAKKRYNYYASLLKKSEFSLLEIGCGTAGLADGFIKCGGGMVEYHGIDIDSRLTRKAVYDGVKNIRNIDFFDIEENERYDVICASQVLEHITKPVAFISKIYLHLNKNGLLHIDVPNHNSLAGFFKKTLRLDKKRYGEIKWPHHLISYSADTMTLLFRKFFNDIKVFSANSNDKTWGQVSFPSILRKVFLSIAKVCKRHNFLVAIGLK